MKTRQKLHDGARPIEFCSDTRLQVLHIVEAQQMWLIVNRQTAGNRAKGRTNSFSHNLVFISVFFAGKQCLPKPHILLLGSAPRGCPRQRHSLHGLSIQSHEELRCRTNEASTVEPPHHKNFAVRITFAKPFKGASRRERLAYRRFERACAGQDDFVNASSGDGPTNRIDFGTPGIPCLRSISNGSAELDVA